MSGMGYHCQLGSDSVTKLCLTGCILWTIGPIRVLWEADMEMDRNSKLYWGITLREKAKATSRIVLGEQSDGNANVRKSLSAQ